MPPDLALGLCLTAILVTAGVAVHRDYITERLYDAYRNFEDMFGFSAGDREICCPGAGCFDANSTFGGLPLPWCAEYQNIAMRLYTRTNTETGQTINRTNIPTEFDGNNTTVFIVHGWLTTEKKPWINELKNTFLNKGDFNVVVVDWSGGSRLLFNYPQSVSNTRSAGTEIGLVAANLIANGNSDKSRLYCVGHSLGAHVCGHAGMKTKFGRITGLDPTGLLYEERPIAFGLNPESADLVDVIHTNGQALFSFGTLRPLGHVDFYPNGGGVQPNCVLLGGRWTEWLPDLRPGCCHDRSISMYTVSVTNPCFLSQYNCSDSHRLPDSCAKTDVAVQSMGFDAVKFSARGIFYLETNGVEPYCILSADRVELTVEKYEK